MADVTEVLNGIARGVLGDGFAPEVGARMRARIEQLPASDRKRLLSALRFVSGTGGALLATGRPRPVQRLSAPEAEHLIQRWQHSPIAAKRGLAKALVGLATSALYGVPGPEWGRIGYPGPLGSAPQASKRLSPIEIDQSQELSCDVVVVGSGAGGGCVAAGLAGAGLDVLLLEKGPYVAEADFTHLELDSVSKMYLYGGGLATTDLGVAVVAGSALGGGTLINYTTAFKTPDHVLREWASITGIDAFVSGEFRESLDEVAERVGMNTDSSAPSMRDRLMEEGLEKLGWHVEALARAVRGCSQDDQCGYCGLGCRLAAKQGTMTTFLEDAAARGTRMVVGADVMNVAVRDGRAVGVEAVANGHRLVVKARAVAVAGGSIETPALLLRSGLRGQVGRNLHLHPGVAAFGVFDQEVRPWTGTLQARYSAELEHLDGDYGLLMETVPIHPGLSSAALPWVSARQHRELVGKLGHLSVCGVAPRDRTSGSVELARDGSVRVRYDLTEPDERIMVEGMIAAGKVMEAAGAKEVFTLHGMPISYPPGPGGHERWAEAVRRVGVRGTMTCFSFHQMGSCRMGTDPASSAVGPDNESHEVANLFVVDASTFPTASGVNPMVTIYAIANRAAKKMVERLA
jgi:choline dehydrogenase-like flavoprotein